MLSDQEVVTKDLRGREGAGIDMSVVNLFLITLPKLIL